LAWLSLMSSIGLYSLLTNLGAMHSVCLARSKNQ